MPGKSAAVVDVQFAIDTPGIPPAPEIRAVVRAALEGAGCGEAVELSVRVTGYDEITALNRDYRGRDRPTNVLSFAVEQLAGQPGGEPRILGDIVVCAPVLADEARAQHKALADHWAHILTHGTLHLLGYDHEHEEEAEAMESLESRILAARGIANPYSAR
jgi:probable rRNA maturation factor